MTKTIKPESIKELSKEATLYIPIVQYDGGSWIACGSYLTMVDAESSMSNNVGTIDSRIIVVKLPR